MGAVGVTLKGRANSYIGNANFIGTGLLAQHGYLVLHILQIFVKCAPFFSHQMAAATREGASTMEGTKMTTGDANTSRTESPGPAKMVGAKKKKYR